MVKVNRYVPEPVEPEGAEGIGDLFLLEEISCISFIFLLPSDNTILPPGVSLLYAPIQNSSDIAVAVVICSKSILSATDASLPPCMVPHLTAASEAVTDSSLTK